MIKKLFQHVDVSDKNSFLNVTSLSYIDDTDPYMILYYFKDDTKCNEEFVGKFENNVTAENIGQFAYVQIEEMSLKWSCKIVEHKAHQTTAMTANGEKVIVPDRTMFSLKGEALNDVTQYNWTAPRKFKKSEDSNLNIFKISNIRYFLETGNLPDELYNPEVHTLKDMYYTIMEISQILDFIPNYVIPHTLSSKMGTLLKNAEIVYNKSEKTTKDEASEYNSASIYKTMEVDNSVEELTVEENEEIKEEKRLDSYYNSHNKLYRIYENANTTWVTDPNDGKDYDIQELLSAYHDYNEMMTAMADKPEHTTETPKISDVLKDVDSSTLSFLTNMIANAAKKTAEASVSIELDVPPFDVYKLLKMAYPENWANVFIDIIATSVAPATLQQALGEGLKAYYEQEMENNKS